MCKMCKMGAGLVLDEAIGDDDALWKGKVAPNGLAGGWEAGGQKGRRGRRRALDWLYRLYWLYLLYGPWSIVHTRYATVPRYT